MDHTLSSKGFLSLWVPRRILTTGCLKFHSNPCENPGVGTVMALIISRLKKMKLSDVRCTSRKKQSWELNPGTLASNSCC